jgi:hypothetical protein
VTAELLLIRDNSTSSRNESIFILGRSRYKWHKAQNKAQTRKHSAQTTTKHKKARKQEKE